MLAVLTALLGTGTGTYALRPHEVAPIVESEAEIPTEQPETEAPIVESEPPKAEIEPPKTEIPEVRPSLRQQLLKEHGQ